MQKLWASWVAQLVKNPPAMQETLVQLLDREDPLEKGIGDPYQSSWASLVTQMVKNSPAMQESWVQSLGWEDPLEEGMATNSSILAWRIPMDRGDPYSPWGRKDSDTTEQLSTHKL